MAGNSLKEREGVMSSSSNIGPVDSTERAERYEAAAKVKEANALRVSEAENVLAEDARGNGAVAQTRNAKNKITDFIPKVRRTTGESVLVRITDDEANKFAGDFAKRQDNLNYHLPSNKFSQVIQKFGLFLTHDTSANGIERFIKEELKSAEGRPADPVHVNKLFILLLEIPEFAPYYKDIEAAKKLHFEENKTNIELTTRLVEGGYVEGLIQGEGEGFEESVELLHSMIEVVKDVFQIRREAQSQGLTFKQQMDVVDKLFSFVGKKLRTFTPLLKGEQQALIQSIKTQQAYKGAFRPFKQTMSLLKKQLREADLKVPEDLTFVALGNQFLDIAEKPYPTSAQVLDQIAKFVDQYTL